MIIINAVGDVCPIPVIKAKDTINELKASDIIQVLVDNEIAVQNLQKLAGQKGFESEYIKENEIFKVNIKAVIDSNSIPEETACQCKPMGMNKVVVIASDVMGDGDRELGAMLIKSFVYALTTQDTLPSTVLFYNGGAKLTCKGSPVLEDLQKLSQDGVEILTCGTCLNFYGLTDELAIGKVTNMYEIVEKQLKADLILKP